MSSRIIRKHSGIINTFERKIASYVCIMGASCILHLLTEMIIRIVSVLTAFRVFNKQLVFYVQPGSDFFHTY